tara:strand:- start:150 stop:311 length:162 start_codon:yes stop_codon:yes gene_type:complete
MPEPVNVCAQCDSTNLEHDTMVLALGQEGNPPKKINVKRCVDCGCQTNDDVSP